MRDKKSRFANPAGHSISLVLRASLMIFFRESIRTGFLYFSTILSEYVLFRILPLHRPSHLSSS
jgi:hypothetical protein